jgi:3,4-dihydroxy 2-butanone 4-phosphate synthase/GTP cyclohydrolase II
MHEDGSMARLDELRSVARRHDLKMFTIADLIRHRMRTERLVKRVASPELPTRLGRQLHLAMDMIAAEGVGAILYLRQEGRGIGLVNKLRAYELQDRERRDTVEANLDLGFAADVRDYGVGAQILYDLGIRRLRLMTNNMGKYVALVGYGLEIVERVPLEPPAHDDNREYLQAKKNKMGHLLRSV